MLKYCQIHSLRWAGFAVSRVVPDLANNVRSLAEKRWQPYEFSDKELLRQVNHNQSASGGTTATRGGGHQCGQCLKTTVNLTKVIHFWPAPYALAHCGLLSLLIC